MRDFEPTRKRGHLQIITGRQELSTQFFAWLVALGDESVTILVSLGVLFFRVRILLYSPNESLASTLVLRCGKKKINSRNFRRN